MKWLLPLVLLSTRLWAADPPLSASSELTLNGPWTQPVALVFPEDGPFRLEATGLGGEPVEVVVERLEGSQGWKLVATNRTLRGSLEAVVDFAFEGGDPWRVRPVAPVTKTVVLRLKRSAFSALKNTLKQELTVGPEVSLPLRLRAALPLASGGEGLAAAASRGQLWVGWLTPSGAEVWDVGRTQRLGPGLTSSLSGPWETLELGGSEAPVVTGRHGDEAEALTWNGQAWSTEAVSTRVVTTRQGTFRGEEGPVPRVWRSTTAGWMDLELPRHRLLDRLLLGSTEDGLYAFLASSSGRERALYRWEAAQGWIALPAPPASEPPREGLWAATNGAGSLFFVEGRGTELTLRQFDGQAWKAPLDLDVLVSAGLRSVALLPPSPWSRTGTLVIASSRVEVYDLP